MLKTLRSKLMLATDNTSLLFGKRELTEYDNVAIILVLMQVKNLVVRNKFLCIPAFSPFKFIGQKSEHQSNSSSKNGEKTTPVTFCGTLQEHYHFLYSVLILNQVIFNR